MEQDTETAQPFFVVVHSPRTEQPVAINLARVLYVEGMGSKPSRLHYVGADGADYSMFVRESAAEFALLTNTAVRGDH